MKTYRFASPSLKRAALPEKIRATLVLPPVGAGELPAPRTTCHRCESHALHVESTAPELTPSSTCCFPCRSCAPSSCPGSFAWAAWTRAGLATTSARPPHDLLFGLENVGRFSNSKMNPRPQTSSGYWRGLRAGSLWTVPTCPLHDPRGTRAAGATEADFSHLFWLGAAEPEVPLG